MATRIESIRVALTQYRESTTRYRETMDLVDRGLVGLELIAEADEKRADGALDFVDDAAEFIGGVLTYIDKIQVALMADAGNHGERTRGAARDLIRYVTASHSETGIEDI